MPDFRSEKPGRIWTNVGFEMLVLGLRGLILGWRGLNNGFWPDYGLERSYLGLTNLV